MPVNTRIFLVDENYVGSDNSEILNPGTLWADNSLVVRVSNNEDWEIDTASLSSDRQVTQIVIFSNNYNEFSELISLLGSNSFLSDTLKVYYFGDQPSAEGPLDLQSLLNINSGFSDNATLYYLGTDKIAASPISSNININTNFTLQLNKAWTKEGDARDTYSDEAIEISSLLADTTGLAPFTRLQINQFHLTASISFLGKALLTLMVRGVLVLIHRKHCKIC
jgi:hypothetical protein